MMMVVMAVEEKVDVQEKEVTNCRENSFQSYPPPPPPQTAVNG